MATEIVMPRLSDTMDSGTIAKWLKHEGDAVKRGETIAEVETDKANMELESYASGVLAKISVGEGESAGVGQPIAVVAASEEEAKKLSSGAEPDSGGPSDKASGEKAEAKPAPESSKPPEQKAEEAPPDQGPPAAPEVGGTEPNERVKASPLARRMAQEHGIELSDVGGTGPGGRVTKEDIESFLSQAGPAPAATTGTSAQPERIEMSRMRQTIARRMSEAKSTTAEFVLNIDVDMTQAKSLLGQARALDENTRLGPNDLLLKACAVALSQHPKVNAGWEGDGIVRYRRVNIGTAVALEDGLVVPVVRDVDKKSLAQVSAEAKDLIAKARSGKAKPADYEGASFTISNLGMYGIEEFIPIINPPAACIMGVGAIEAKPVVIHGGVTVRERMQLTLVCDHRVVTGSEGAEFLQTVKKLLENPVMALLQLAS